MATTADIRTRVRDMVYSARPPQRPFVTLVTEAVDNSETLIDVTAGTDWAAGDILEFSDGEQFYVQSVATNTLSGIRAYNGTTIATHAINDQVRKNPRFTVQQIDQAIEDTLRELETNGIHVWGTGSITLVATSYAYDITGADVLDILAVYYPRNNDGVAINLPFRFHRQTTGLSASNRTLEVWDWGERVAGDTLLYTYQKQIDDVTDLMVRQEELVVIGTAARLLKRTIAPETHDPGKRTDRTVQPGQTGRDSRELMGEYVRLLTQESQMLKVERSRFLPAGAHSSRSRRWRF